MTDVAVKTLVGGIDVATDVRHALPCLVQQKKTFVARYLAITSEIPNKILTPIEAKAISDAGLDIVSVWENGAADTPEYFTRAHGERDGEYAYKLAESLGQPGGSPIYFAIDYDAPLKDLLHGVNEYLDAVEQGLASAYAASTTDRWYAVGIYGSGLTCAVLRVPDSRPTWLAEAQHWAGSTEFDLWDIHQTGSTSVCGLGCDENVAYAGQYGGWRVTVPTA